jgi:hypothetical protein
MPTDLIDDEDGMGIRRDRLRYLREMRLHGGGVAERQDHARALALGRAEVAPKM